MDSAQGKNRNRSELEGGQQVDGQNVFTALEERLDRVEDNLNSRRRQLIQRILDESQETYFLSSRELAKRYHVDVGTIVRTIQAMGYRRYADFVSDLRSHFVVRINPYTVMKAATRKGQHSLSEHILSNIELGAHNLSVLRAELHLRKVVELAKRINHSRKIVVVGVDVAWTLSYLLSYWLGALGFDSEAPVGTTGHLNQKVQLLGRKDLLIAISFGRCLKATVNAAIQARERGAFTFGITDSMRSPIARFCDSCLIAPTDSPKLSISYVAPVSAIETILTACAYLNPKRTLAVLKRKEEEQLQPDSRWYSPGRDEDRRRRG